MPRTRTLIAILSVACICLSSACGSRSGSESILKALPNAEYPIDVVSTGRAQLKDGVFEEAAAPGSATGTRISLGRYQASGDLNGDAVLDAAVTLIADPGGSGTFTYVAAVLNRSGTAEPVATVLMGDRVIVRSLAIQDGYISVTILTRKPDEPMAVEPTVSVSMRFRLRGYTLMEVEF